MKPSLRTGTASLALSLILAGGGLLAANLAPGLKTEWILRLWPVVPILLGLEITLRAAVASRRGLRLAWDPAALALLVVLTLGLLAASQWPAIRRELAGAPALESYTLVEEEILALGPETKRLAIRQNWGAVRVLPGEGPGVRMEARVTGSGATLAEAEGNAQALRWEVDTGPTLFIRPVLPSAEPQAESGLDQLPRPGPALAAVNRVGWTSARPPRAVADLTLYVPPAIEQVRVESSYGEVEARDLPGSLELICNLGKVRVSGLGGDLYLEGNLLGEARVAGVRGSSRLTLTHTSLDLADCEGRVEVKGSYGRMEIRRPGGALEVISRQGVVEVETDRPPQGDWDVEVEYAQMRVALPEDSNVRLDATARFGSIQAPHNLAVRQEDSAARLQHVLGAGEHRLRLESINGPIAIDLL
ncbi:MAG: hypothetical protein K6T75_07445 [Acetobacteraceae bacterium]|nr:hypothetical protein [Acetobacteraceae bacterium]